MINREYLKLHAEWYELASAAKDHAQEIEFWMQSIRNAGQPVLELGSGTGRVLIPLLERGVDIVGVDTSIEMMNRCRASCEAKGLKAELHQQSMLTMDMPRKFGLIILDSGGLGLFVSDQDIQCLFERVRAHLKPGGAFIYEFEVVPQDDQNKNDTVWSGDWLSGPEGVVIAWRRKQRYDAATHIWHQLFIVEKFVDGRLIETEANERSGRRFNTEEAVRLTEASGFTDVRATDWLTEKAPNSNTRVVTVRCRKP